MSRTQLVDGRLVNREQTDTFTSTSHYEMSILNKALEEYAEERPNKEVQKIVTNLRERLHDTMYEIEEQWKEKSVCHGLYDTSEDDEGHLYED